MLLIILLIYFILLIIIEFYFILISGKQKSLINIKDIDNIEKFDSNNAYNNVKSLIIRMHGQGIKHIILVPNVNMSIAPFYNNSRIMKVE